MMMNMCESRKEKFPLEEADSSPCRRRPRECTRFLRRCRRKGGYEKKC